MPIHKQLRLRAALRGDVDDLVRPDGMMSTATQSALVEEKGEMSSSSSSSSTGGVITATFSSQKDLANLKSLKREPFHKMLLVSEDSDREPESSHLGGTIGGLSKLVGTSIRKYFVQYGWLRGSVQAVDEAMNTYFADFEGFPGNNSKGKRDSVRRGPYSASELIGLVNFAQVHIGSKVEVFWDGDNAYYSATVTRERPEKRKSFYLVYDADGEEEWIDFSRHQYRILPASSALAGVFQRTVSAPSTTRQEIDEKSLECQSKSCSDSERSMGEASPPKSAKMERSVARTRAERTRPESWIEDAPLTRERCRRISSDPAVKKKNSIKLSTKRPPGLQRTPPRRVDESQECAGLKGEPKKDSSANDVSLVTIGTRVAIYWPGEQKYYTGTVKREKFVGKHLFFVEYDDGDEEWIDFKREKFQIRSGKRLRKEEKEVTAEASRLEKVTKMTPPKKESDLEGDFSRVTIGSKVAIWWGGDQRYYKGIVTRQRDHNMPFYVEYLDGEKEWLDFRCVKFRLLDKEKGDVDADDTGDEADSETSSKDDRASRLGPNSKRARPSSTDSDDRLKIGSRLEVWWPMEKQYFKCTLTRLGKDQNPHYLEYDDGDREWCDLNQEEYRFVRGRKPKTLQQP